MLSRRLAQDSGRLALLALILGFGLYFAVAGPAARLALWRTSGFPTMIPTFGDARVITSGWECTTLGYDVLRENPCDPFGRAMNYPRIWTVPALVDDVGQGWTGRLAAAFAASFILALLAVVGRISVRVAAVYGIALASPSVLLALERGNSDLLIFALVATAAVLSARGRVVWSGAALLVAIILKLYPAAAIGALRDKRARIVVTLATAAYLVATSTDIGLILEHTSRQQGWSYGLLTASGAILPGLPLPAAPIVLGIVLVLAAVLLARLRPIPPVSASARTTFIAGASVYVTSFVLGPSWDYRLIFLLLTLPALIELTHADRFVLLALVLASLWTSRDVGEPAYWVDQVVKTAAAVGCLAAVIGLWVPRWGAGRRPRHHVLAVAEAEGGG